MPKISSIFNRYAILKKIPVFEKLGWMELQRIARKSRLVDFKKGEIIRRQGDPPDAFYCLISGRVLAYKTGADGEKRDVDFIRRGMHFGIISLLTSESHSSTYEVVNDSVLLKIVKSDFLLILKSIPQLGVELSQSLSRRIHNQTVQDKAPFESKIISIYSPVKGSGCSTYAANLAFSLHRETKRKVILVHISSEAEREAAGEGTAPEAAPQWISAPVKLRDIIGDYERIIQSVGREDNGLDLMHVSIHPADTAIVHQISDFVTALVNNYRFVVVDLPSHMDEIVIKTLTQSDIVQLVTPVSYEHLKTTRQVIYKLEERLRENFQHLKIQVITSGLQQSDPLSGTDINQELDYPVFIKLPTLESSFLTERVAAKGLSILLPSSDTEYAQAVRRVARRIGGVLVGLVLGGGAALGVAHVGVLKVLEEEKIPIDIVVGSSMGALLGSFWAIGKSADELEALAREFEPGWRMWKLHHPILPIRGLVGGGAIARWLKKTLGDRTFFDTRVPLKIVAYDLAQRQELVIESGKIIDAVRKSIAIPGVIPPVQEDGRVIIDGGVLNPLPTNVLVQMGINRIIAVNVLQSPAHVIKGYELEQQLLQRNDRVRFLQSPGEFLSHRFQKGLAKIFTPNIADIIVRTLQATEYETAIRSAQAANVVIHPNLESVKWFELYRVDDLLKSGREAALNALNEIKALVKE
ncbi:MAG: patatin-like phospholipase family protein [Candidatus Omnitrophota bacterium]|nr:patatin-like phospholipase family protein [Candidatus Omnitrophota bacterium]MDZ4243083.1 patatin-like phospholipase family protein [Candidatus Omnitrophota bacterium]